MNLSISSSASYVILPEWSCQHFFTHNDGAIGHHSIRNKEYLSLFQQGYSEFVAGGLDEATSLLFLPYAYEEGDWL